MTEKRPKYDGSWHVVPLADTKEHRYDKDCWCEPELDPDAEGLLYIHNALDGRDKKVH